MCDSYADPGAARDAGFRACLRCRPDSVARDRVAVAKALEILGKASGVPTLAFLAAAVGYAPHHFQRIFTRDVGLSPSAYARGLRARRASAALNQEEKVSDAIYDSGFAAPSRFYADVDDRLGMTPSAWRNGGKGETIRFVIVDSLLGSMLVAATKRGICRLSFDEDETALKRLFPNAEIIADDGTMTAWVDSALKAVERPGLADDVPIDVAGTAFQEAVWRELRRIPPGQTRTYAQIAAAVGKPGAVRAAGSANGANHVSVLIPCHRVIRSDGSLGGYAWGLDRKRRLLAAEGGD